MYKYVIYTQLEPFLSSFAPYIPCTKRTVPLRRSISLLSDIPKHQSVLSSHPQDELRLSQVETTRIAAPPVD